MANTVIEVKYDENGQPDVLRVTIGDIIQEFQEKNGLEQASGFAVKLHPSGEEKTILSDKSPDLDYAVPVVGGKAQADVRPIQTAKGGAGTEPQVSADAETESDDAPSGASPEVQAEAPAEAEDPDSEEVPF